MLRHISLLWGFVVIASGQYYDTSYVNRIDTTARNAGPLTTVFTAPSSCSTPSPGLWLDRPALTQACQGPYGNECCPDGWKFTFYFSPGRCPYNYKTCTLPTTTQREETTVICCPQGFDCYGQNYCGKTFNVPTTITYSDPTLSAVTTVRAMTADGIQIRFKASESTLVPIVTDSLRLPKDHSLSKGTKIGIGIGVPAGVILVGFLGFWGVRRYRRRMTRRADEAVLVDVSSLGRQREAPPAYSRRVKV
ncbi:hypothetical protein POX_h09789 [Penicillium oxalicum]|uniref:Mid2 domain-containing protein n=1 Tax=Penicillium oxalicum (strain 114-2 / CGMCC 5302) TaxID=933388 RepID=S8B9N8_PENO1|nr:hypothetical protein POX_h09789 [Penicillium oxalicum]EPS31507.1 hypothetical protein PDE_06462 [Penicillium oxalicum 114-2]KAI2786024.1 hypothetical protein POX_h09789 [Penicillium oxalicum]